MNNILVGIVFALGAAVVVWISAGFVGSHAFALLVTLTIGLVYLLGFIELRAFRRATTSLVAALEKIPARLEHLDHWLQPIHPSLQNAVRLRVEGERQPLPGPVFAPYLAGLLVMLGLLGTFIGMVVTLKGAVLALEGTTELGAMREGLTAPIKGLGLAFGTSVAGVATSAMLGLMITLARRERLQASNLLDRRMVSELRPFSLAYHRQQTFQAMQQQAQALPLLVQQLQGMGEQLVQSSQQLGATLQANQQRMHDDMQASVTMLVQNVAESLQQHLELSAQQTSQTVAPLLSSTLEQIQRSAEATSQQMLTQTTQTLAQTHNQLQQESAETIASIQTSLKQAAEQQQAADQSRLEQWSLRFETLAGNLREHWQQGSDALAERQQQLVATMAQSAQRIIVELQETSARAAEAPRAAAELIEQMRQQTQASTEQDNALLAERTHLLNELVALISQLGTSAQEQRRAVESLVQSADAALQQTRHELTEQLASGSTRLEGAAVQLAANGHEVAALGDAFTAAVERFGQIGEQQVESFRQVEAALEKSGTRSDEQLAYYVAQAREIIDLSVMSQKEIFEELRRISHRNAQQADAEEVC